MAQHRALRRARRARGIDHDRDIVGFGEIDLGVERLVGARMLLAPRTAAFDQRVERHESVVMVVAHALHVDADDRLHVGHAVAIRHGVQNLVGLFLIAGKDDAGAAMAHDILQLRPGIGRIDAGDRRAQHLGAEVGVIPFGRVLAGDGDAVAALQAERLQAESDEPRGLVVMRPGEAFPDPVLFFADRERVRMRGRAQAQQLGQRDVGGRPTRREVSEPIRAHWRRSLPVPKDVRADRDRRRERPDRCALRRACRPRSSARNSAPAPGPICP